MNCRHSPLTHGPTSLRPLRGKTACGTKTPQPAWGNGSLTMFKLYANIAAHEAAERRLSQASQLLPTSTGGPPRCSNQTREHTITCLTSPTPELARITATRATGRRLGHTSQLPCRLYRVSSPLQRPDRRCTTLSLTAPPNGWRGAPRQAAGARLPWHSIAGK